MLQRSGILKLKSSVSLAELSRQRVFLQVRNGANKVPDLSKAKYPCIMAEKPIAESFVSVIPYLVRTSFFKSE